jgi:hypothetical protein
MICRRRITPFVLTLLGCTLVTAGVRAQDPFGAAADPFGAAAAADPFSAAADPFAATAGAPAADPFAPSFGATADPFSSAPTSSPFDSAPVAAPTTGAAPADPFAAAPAAGSPFGAAPAASSPFGAPPPASSPFGAAPAPATGASDPFGSSPFNTGMPAADPFGSAPIDPFAAPTTRSAEGGTGTGIARLFQFRFMETRRPDGTRTVVRRQMTKEEAEAFDKTITDFYTDLGNRGELPGYQAGVYDLNDWVQWMAYSYQLKLWQQYCEDIVLVGSGFERGSREVVWPGDNRGPQQAAAETGRPQRPADIRNENRSLDDQLQDFNPLADTRPGGQGRVVFDPKQIDDQTVSIFQAYEEALRRYETEQEGFIQSLIADLDQRALQREAYAEWRRSQLDIVMDFVNEWNRRYEGQVTVVAGVRYELYRPDAVPTETVRGAIVITTDYDLTPHDILNSDGTLRGPSTR